MVAIPVRSEQERAMQLFQPSQLPAAADIARHHHREPYATVVLTGAYEEAGDAGRMAAEAGEVLLHGAFSQHRDRVSAERTVVLDLPLPFAGRDWPARERIAAPDRIVRAFERDPRSEQRRVGKEQFSTRLSRYSRSLYPKTPTIHCY